MRDALAYEILRLRTLRSTWWISGSALLVGVGISVLVARALNQEAMSAELSMALPKIGPALATQLAATELVPSLVSFLLAIIGVLAWGHEFRYGTIRLTMTALPSRTAVAAAKALVIGVWVAFIAVLTMGSAVLISAAILGDRVEVLTPDTFEAMGLQTLFAVMLSWIAMAVTVIARSQPFALITLFMWPFLIETIAAVIFRIVPSLRDDIDLLRFLPFSAGRRISTLFDGSEAMFGDPLSTTGAIVVFGGYLVVLSAIAVTLLNRRDL